MNAGVALLLLLFCLCDARVVPDGADDIRCCDCKDLGRLICKLIYRHLPCCDELRSYDNPAAATTGVISKVTNGVNRGDWARWDSCQHAQDGGSARAFSVRVDHSAKAMTGIMLHCAYQGQPSNNATSAFGKGGSWKEGDVCNDEQMVAFQLYVKIYTDGPNSTWGIKDINFKCADNQVAFGKSGLKSQGTVGKWSSPVCNHGICGIKTRYEQSGNLLDDVEFLCCPNRDSPPPPLPPTTTSMQDGMGNGPHTDSIWPWPLMEIWVPNGVHQGLWAEWAYCPYLGLGGYAVGFSIKVDDSAGAMTGIRLHCVRGGRDNGTVPRENGEPGEWTEERSCFGPVQPPLVAFRLNVRPVEDPGMNWGIKDINFLCADGNSALGNSGLDALGEWGPWSNPCPFGTSVCGISTRVENGFLVGFHLDDVKFACCPFSP